MAEIKSTMEMVLERAARMEKEAATGPESTDFTKDGMRIAAAFMNNTEEDMVGQLQQSAPEKQQSIRGGMVQVLLRNILLPRDEDLQATGKKAIDGLIMLSNGNADIANICTELGQILEQYGQHKDQMTEQLNSAIRGQLQQQQAMEGGEGVAPQDINPAAHPQYAQELSKMLGDLNDQYNQAIDQRKDMIKQIFGE